MKFKELEKKYKALANRRRLEIILFLSKSQGAVVGDIATEIKLSFNATSKHLQILKNSNFVDSDQVSTEQYYYIVNKNDIFIKQVLSIL